MRTILIAGAGQAGLQLALGLQARGYGVTLMTDRLPDEIRSGPATSTQLLFGTALRHERHQGLDLWGEEAPPVGGIDVVLPDAPAARWTGRLSRPARSVDPRLKLAAWLEMFLDGGGSVVHHVAAPDDLAWAADRYDLVVCATGHHALRPLFPRDPARSPAAAPLRSYAAVHLHGLWRPAPPARGHGPIRPLSGGPDAEALGATRVAGAGEILLHPALGPAGRCDLLTVAAVPGGPWDVFRDATGPVELLDRLRALVERDAPHLRARGLDRAEPADARAALVGRRTPTVREPVAELPSGGAVFGLGEAVVGNDPVALQTGNCAAGAAVHYLRCILARGDRPFDRAWMRDTFEGWWARSGRPATRWSHALLRTPAPHLEQRLRAAAAEDGSLADAYADAFDDPARAVGCPRVPDVAERVPAVRGAETVPAAPCGAFRGTPCR